MRELDRGARFSPGDQVCASDLAQFLIDPGNGCPPAQSLPVNPSNWLPGAHPNTRDPAWRSLILKVQLDKTDAKRSLSTLLPEWINATRLSTAPSCSCNNAARGAAAAPSATLWVALK